MSDARSYSYGRISPINNTIGEIMQHQKLTVDTKGVKVFGDNVQWDRQIDLSRIKPEQCPYLTLWQLPVTTYRNPATDAYHDEATFELRSSIFLYIKNERGEGNILTEAQKVRNDFSDWYLATYRSSMYGDAGRNAIIYNKANWDLPQQPALERFYYPGEQPPALNGLLPEFFFCLEIIMKIWVNNRVKEA
jgi:hypothetical protein